MRFIISEKVCGFSHMIQLYLYVISESIEWDANWYDMHNNYPLYKEQSCLSE